MNGLTTLVTASKVSAPPCSVAKDVTEGGAVDDSADPAVSTSDLISGAATAEL